MNMSMLLLLFIQMCLCMMWCKLFDGNSSPVFFHTRGRGIAVGERASRQEQPSSTSWYHSCDEWDVLRLEEWTRTDSFNQTHARSLPMRDQLLVPTLSKYKTHPRTDPVVSKVEKYNPYLYNITTIPPIQTNALWSCSNTITSMSTR